MSVFGNVLHVCAEELRWVSQYCGYAMGWMLQGFIPGSDSDFILFRMPTLVLGPTQSPIQEILCLFPQS